jgi:hypothetical protein
MAYRAWSLCTAIENIPPRESVARRTCPGSNSRSELTTVVLSLRERKNNVQEAWSSRPAGRNIGQANVWRVGLTVFSSRRSEMTTFRRRRHTR